MNTKHKAISAVLAGALGIVALPYPALCASPQYRQTYRPPANAPAYRDNFGAQPYRQGISFHEYISSHPKLKSATVGAGVGTAAGVITGLVTGRGALRGAVLGAGTGAGAGLLHSSEIMKRHPIVKNIAAGTMVGMGLGLVGGRVPGTAARTAAVGAAAGLGTALLTHGL